jgi:hypothetical protein
MSEFRIRRPEGDGRAQLFPRPIRAASYEHAATIAARRMHGRRAVAIRTTGDAGKSGFFQAYLPLKTGGLVSTGDPFHVM